MEVVTLVIRLLKNIFYATGYILLTCAIIILLCIHIVYFNIDEVYLITSNIEIFFSCFLVLLVSLSSIMIGSICSSIEHWN